MVKAHEVVDAGYYWYRYKEGPWLVVLHRGAGMFQLVGDETLLACNLPGEFTGPLTPPTEARRDSASASDR